MRYIRILTVIVLPLVLISFLWSQDLTEAAKKEKARREAIKKKVTVITNAELESVKKKPSVQVENPDQPAEPEAPPADQAEAGNAAAANQAAENTDRGEPSTAGDNVPKIVPEVNTSQKATATPMQQAQESQKSALETKWLKAKEYADLLELKMNGLWQDFYNMDDMTPKDQIQQQIADTFDKYQKAREDETKAKEALDKYLGSGKKD
jgi:hypothetical protein